MYKERDREIDREGRDRDKETKVNVVAPERVTNENTKTDIR